MIEYWILTAVAIFLILFTVIKMKKNDVHIIYELLAIPLGIFLIWYGLNEAMDIYKYLFIVIGAGNIIVDGWLLYQNTIKK